MISGTALARSRQLLLLVADDWSSDAGRLRCFGRMSEGEAWQAAMASVMVSLGRNGLAWGRGLHAEAGAAGPSKREGDGRAPAGIFAITSLFGNATADSPLALAAKLPYQAATPDLKAIDDPASAYYNRIVDQTAVAPDWASCEDMQRSDGRYAVGAVVAHNADPVLPGAGSCIFLHVWASPGVATEGCTAMALADMTALTGWLDASATPLLVQLPQAEYEARQFAWGLPPLAP